MALILESKYQKPQSGYTLFYTNRILRLMPLYFLFLAISICLSYLSTTSTAFPEQASTSAILNLQNYNALTFLVIILSNVLVLGHDFFALFLGVDPDGTLFFNLNKMSVPRLEGEYFFIPQSWTLSLEFYFYLIIPFLIKRKKIIYLLVCLSLALRLYLYGIGLDHSFWRYAFFPNELGLFLLGTISYSLYVFLKERKLFNKTKAMFVSFLVIAMTLGYQFLPQQESILSSLRDAELIYFTFVVLGLPFLFHQSMNSKTDRFIGELSYPIYLSHLMIIPFFGRLYIADKNYTVLLSLLTMTLVISSLSVIFIQMRVDTYRQKRIDAFHRKSANKLTVATDAKYPPLVMFDKNDRMVGYEIDLMRAITEHIGYDAEYVYAKTGEMFRGLYSGKYDIILPSVEISKNMKRKYDFSEPYLSIERVLLVPGSKAKIKSLSEIKANVGIIAGSFDMKLSVQFPGLNLMNYNDLSTALQDFYAGKIEGLICDTLTAHYIRNNDGQKSEIIRTRLSKRRIGAIVRRGNHDLLTLINRGIRFVMEKGIDKEFEKKWEK